MRQAPIAVQKTSRPTITNDAANVDPHRTGRAPDAFQRPWPGSWQMTWSAWPAAHVSKAGLDSPAGTLTPS
jgi:hypothetical protein